MAKESPPKPPKGDKKKDDEAKKKEKKEAEMRKKEEEMRKKEEKKEEENRKKEEKKKKKDLKKSKESLNQQLGSEVPEDLPSPFPEQPLTPKSKRKKDKVPASPGRESQCSSSSKKKGIFKRIGSFMLPATALAPASPTAQQDLIATSQSCLELAGGSPRMGRLTSNSISSPNLFSSPPGSPPPPGLMRGDSTVSVEYSIPVKRLKATLSEPLSSEDDDCSPRRRSSIRAGSPRKDRRISFASNDHLDQYPDRGITPEILKKDLFSEFRVPEAPPTSYLDIVELPEPSDLDSLPLQQRCDEQSKLLQIYETKIHSFRDQVLDIVSENSRLQSLVSKQGSRDIERVQEQAHQVLQENRTLIKEQQMNQARWQELIEERNNEVLRIRAICSNMEEQNTTLAKRCTKLEDKNEELREAYNSIASSATQADDFVPVAAHLSSIEGYKTALEELRKRYEDNLHDKKEEIEGLEGTMGQLSERVEGLEEENALLHGRSKGLQESLERAQHSATRHKREVVQLTQRCNTLKTSLAQAINIAEQSTLQKLELAEISDIQDKQKRTFLKETSDTRVKEVKKVANAKLKSCAEIIKEREIEHEKNIAILNERIGKLKSRCQAKDERIQSLTSSDKSL